jgi:hypothetical protein
MKTCAIVGINWGDEGKGRMVDLIAKDYDVVVRYQGGSNAGHTVINEYGKFALNLIPSGIFRPKVINILGNGTVIDLEHLSIETEKLRKAGVQITSDNLKISDRAMIVLPYHKVLDELEENRLKDKKYGSTENTGESILLHSALLSFRHPVRDELMQYYSPPPAAFGGFIDYNSEELAEKIRALAENFPFRQECQY